MNSKFLFSNHILPILMVSCFVLSNLSCSNSQIPNTSSQVVSTLRGSIKNYFRIESSGTFPDSLAPLYPNPFNRNIGDSAVAINFTLKDTGEVKIIIQNPIGDSVAIFRDSVLLPGSFSGAWQPVETDGTRLRAGLYFITIRVAPDDPTRNYIDSRLLQIQSND